MQVIYSNEVIDGIEGVYVNPRLFDENNLEKVTKVYATDLKILEAYKKIGVEVIDLTPKRSKK